MSDQRRSAERRRKSRSRLLRADVRALGEAVVDPLDPVLVRRELRLVAVLLVARHAREVRRVVLDEEAVRLRLVLARVVVVRVVHDVLIIRARVNERAAEERVADYRVRGLGKPAVGPATSGTCVFVTRRRRAVYGREEPRRWRGRFGRGKHAEGSGADGDGALLFFGGGA